MTTALSTQQAQAKQGNLIGALIDHLKQATHSQFENVDVRTINEGTKIVLPEGMTTEEGIKTLQRLLEEERSPISVHEEIMAYPLDGAYAMMQVLKRKFGWAQAVPTPGFFGPIPPTMVNLEVNHGEHVSVIWGEFAIPGIKGNLATGASMKEGRPIFTLSGEVRQGERAKVKEIADEIRQYVRDHSVYKGKAIRLRTNDSGNFDVNNPPNFLDLSKVNENELTFSDEVRLQVETNLFAPIEHTAQCREHGIPLKRGVLLEGRYGTGKTLTAFVTAKKCVQNDWTFIYVDRVTGLKQAINFARLYGPAVIFAEDIDRVLSGGRTLKVDDILNTIDGIDSKGSEIITILTTNHLEKVEEAMLRPGRLDAIISVKAPDSKAAEKLIRIYARGLIDIRENLKKAGEELNGQIPAVIREVVERSKLAAIRRLKEGEPLKLEADDVVIAAQGMKHHIELMKGKTVVEPSNEEKVGTALKDLLTTETENQMKKIINNQDVFAKRLQVTLN